MNKVLKMDYKGKTAVLSAIFVLVGMMFLVPAGTEKALAGIWAFVRATCGPEGKTHPCAITPVDKSLSGGLWKQEPWGSVGSGGWETIGLEKTFAEPSEKGSVTFKVGGERAVLSFENPVIGSNACHISGSCTAGKGWSNAHFEYNLRSTQAFEACKELKATIAEDELANSAQWKSLHCESLLK